MGTLYATLAMLAGAAFFPQAGQHQAEPRVSGTTACIPTPITGGAYLILGTVTNPGTTPCFTLNLTSAFTLDCGVSGKIVGGFNATEISGATNGFYAKITGCAIGNPDYTAPDTAFNMTDSRGLILKGNKIYNRWSFQKAANMIIGMDSTTYTPTEGNTFYDSGGLLAEADNVAIWGNKFLGHTKNTLHSSFPYMVDIQGANAPNVQRNYCDGAAFPVEEGSDYIATKYDNCFLFQDVRALVLWYNTGKNVFNLCWEFAGYMADDRIQFNYCGNSPQQMALNAHANAAVGGYYCINAWNNVINLNSMYNVPTAVIFLRLDMDAQCGTLSGGHRACASVYEPAIWGCAPGAYEGDVFFQGNWITFNTYAEQDRGIVDGVRARGPCLGGLCTQSEGSATVYVGGPPISIDMHVTGAGLTPVTTQSGTCISLTNGTVANSGTGTTFPCSNIVGNNIIYSAYAPHLVPLTGFTDNGFNICRLLPSVTGTTNTNPLTCAISQK